MSIQGDTKRLLRALMHRAGFDLVRATAPQPTAFEVQRQMFDTDIVIFDVGAHTGETSSIYRRLFPNSSIRAFEPTPTSVDTLRHRFADDHLLSVHRLALSDRAGSASFTVNRSDATNSLLKTDASVHEGWRPFVETEQVIDVETQTLDGFCVAEGIAAIDILKLDVQGAELRVLQGARQLLAAGRIQAVYLEIIVTPTYLGQSPPAELLATLQAAGLKLIDVYDLNRHGPILLQFDALFARPALYARLIECEHIGRSRENRN
jgi:FkbM family methyltransferase